MKKSWTEGRSLDSEYLMYFVHVTTKQIIAELLTAQRYVMQCTFFVEFTQFLPLLYHHLLMAFQL